MRRHCTFACEGDQLVGTVDAAAGRTGLLIVTGGNELRSGAWGSQALLAARIAAAGHPVFRFDRRGTGDSTGENGGFRSARADILAALAAFRREAPQVTRIVAFGNCDAAAALMLSAGADADALVLANPWTIEEAVETANEPAADSLRAHYRERLRDPTALLRLLRGGVALKPLLQSLLRAARRSPPATLAAELRSGLAEFSGPVTILLAGRDRTAQTFLARWDKADPRLRHCPGATHSFVEPAAQDWLVERLLEALGSG